MTIAWLDVIKLTVPFVTAVLVVWIKAWIEIYLATSSKQHALSRLISDELNSLQPAVDSLRRIAESAVHKKLRLVSLNVSSLLSEFACDLSALDAKQAYRYADLASSVDLVVLGLTRLSSLVVTRASAKEDDVKSQIDRAICGQSKIAASDIVALAKSELEVAKSIPKRRRYIDDQALSAFTAKVGDAEKSLENWPTLAD